MAERVEQPEVEVEEALDQISPTAVAVALRRTGRGKDAEPIDAEAAAFLRDQRRLIHLQTEHLHEQRELTLSHLRWRRFSDRMKALLQVMTAAVGLLIAVGIGGMAWTAANEHGLVIEPFSVPPDLAQKGLTGQVVASMLLDRLGEMQSATQSSRAPSTYANNWNDEIKVEIPETGVSVGELQRLLVQWLGRQTSISGELYRTSSGLALAARTGAAPAKSHPGTEADLETMVQQAAEDVYATTQPYRYAVFVAEKDDPASIERSKQLMQHLALTGEPVDRLWASGGLAGRLEEQGDFAGSIRQSKATIALDPRFPLAHVDLSSGESDLGRDEAALTEARASVDAFRRYGSRFMTASALALGRLSNEANLANTVGDFRLAAEKQGRVTDLSGADPAARLALAIDQAWDHDLTAARDTAAALRLAAEGSPSKAMDLTPLAVEIAAANIALRSEDWAGLKASVARAFAVQAVPPGFRAIVRLQSTPILALAEARLGDLKAAQALVATSSMDCYTCVWTRGEIAALAGDWPSAERWFGEAVRQGPSLPFAWTEWGRMRLGHGDTDGAIAALSTAHAKSPNFADPLELWGEALVQKHDFAGAAVKFAEADKDAPKWGRNHLRWGEALLLAGRYAEARTQFQAADALDLNPPDRAALGVFLARTALGPLHR